MITTSSSSKKSSNWQKGAKRSSSSSNLNNNIGRSEIYLSRVGQATLVLQIEDSMSREVLARIVDRRAAQPAGGGDITFAMPSSSASTNAEVRRLARTWARLLTRGLDKWHESGGNVN